MKRLFNIVILLVIGLLSVYASNQCTIRIQDASYIPIVKDQENGCVNLTSPIPEWNSVLKEFHFVNFQKFSSHFDKDSTNWLRELYNFSLKDSIELKSFMTIIQEKFSNYMPYVARIYDPILCSVDSYIPNDPKYLSGDQEFLDYINVPRAWSIAKHYPKIKVGVNDIYFHNEHPDLSFEHIFGPNIYNNNDHGTAVSGIIGAIIDNNEGLASAGGFNTKLYGSYWSGHAYLDSLVETGCKVINCSWIGGTTWSQHDYDYYYNIVNNDDVILVFSAGNGPFQAINPNTPYYPASYDCCLSVSSIGYKRELGSEIRRNWKGVHCLNIDSPDSTHNHNAAVDIVAPGYELSSTNYWHGEADYGHNYSGTSFSAPLVAAVTAMVRAVNPNLNAWQVMDIIKTTADPSIYDIPENAPYIGRLGNGKLDAYAAVRKACATDMENEIIQGHVEQDGCIVTIKDCSMELNSELIIDAVVETEIISGFEAPLGCELQIW